MSVSMNDMFASFEHVLRSNTTVTLRKQEQLELLRLLGGHAECVPKGAVGDVMASVVTHADATEQKGTLYIKLQMTGPCGSIGVEPNDIINNEKCVAQECSESMSVHVNDDATSMNTPVLLRSRRSSATGTTDDSSHSIAKSLRISPYNYPRTYDRELFFVTVEDNHYLICGRHGDIDDVTYPTYYSMNLHGMCIYAVRSVDEPMRTDATEVCDVEWTARHPQLWEGECHRDNVMKQIQHAIPTLTADQTDFLMTCLEKPSFCKKYTKTTPSM